MVARAKRRKGDIERGLDACRYVNVCKRRVQLITLVRLQNRTWRAAQTSIAANYIVIINRLVLSYRILPSPVVQINLSFNRSMSVRCEHQSYASWE